MNGAAFLPVIAASPNDTTSALVFADWLEESGEAILAEHIRVQCERIQLENKLKAALTCDRKIMIDNRKELFRSRPFLAKWIEDTMDLAHLEWYDLLAGGMIKFRRGLLHFLDCDADLWAVAADDLLAENPTLCRVCLSGETEERSALTKLFESRGLEYDYDTVKLASSIWPSVKFSYRGQVISNWKSSPPPAKTHKLIPKLSVHWYAKNPTDQMAYQAPEVEYHEFESE